MRCAKPKLTSNVVPLLVGLRSFEMGQGGKKEAERGPGRSSRRAKKERTL